MHRLHEFFSSIFINTDVEFLLQLEKENEDITIESDQTKLEQILSNLINNAAKFTTEGYVKLGYKFLENKLRFYVEDTGPGIPPSEHENIFQRFSKYEDSNIKYSAGTGLGLSISKGLTEFLDGEIGVASGNGKGAIFYVDFLLIEIMQLDGDEEKKYSF
jgi:signal transduction histidine kinase